MRKNSELKLISTVLIFFFLFSFISISKSSDTSFENHQNTQNDNSEPKTSSSISIQRPTSYTVVDLVLDPRIEIEWNSGVVWSVNIHLCDFLTKIENLGSSGLKATPFYRNITGFYKPDKYYCILLEDPNDIYNYEYSDFFTIKNDNYPEEEEEEEEEEPEEEATVIGMEQLIPILIVVISAIGIAVLVVSLVYRAKKRKGGIQLKKQQRLIDKKQRRLGKKPRAIEEKPIVRSELYQKFERISNIVLKDVMQTRNGKKSINALKNQIDKLKPTTKKLLEKILSVPIEDVKRMSLINFIDSIKHGEIENRLISDINNFIDFRQKGLIKKEILELGTRFSRLSIAEIMEKTSVAEEGIITSTILEMIENKMIYAEFFQSTKTIVFNLRANIDEIDNLMAIYKEWEDDKNGKK